MSEGNDLANRLAQDFYTEHMSRIREGMLARRGGSTDALDVECDVEIDAYDLDGVSRDQLLSMLDKALEEVPAVHRDTVSYHFSTYYEYGETYPQAFLRYTRPETAEETAERLAAFAAVSERQEEAARADYERLKAQFG